ncbi:ABC transporter substrate-binding protein [Gemmobacter serpentinus]|uniref:ABC transporter substrate-binding protein n=1 Tax=Gemmobacter serpentinus TaxID=2652247 RepID=UPI00124E42B9|nr:ABC transporter substrate-binding protein [Gemmobacter serpentinus]
MKRRDFLTRGTALLCAAPALAQGPAAETAPRLAAIDWGAAEALIALGIRPVAISDSHYFASRMPFDLPAGIADIGPFWEINLEYLSRLAPDLILAPASALVMTPRIVEIAPVQIIPEEAGTDRLDLAARLAAEMAKIAVLPADAAPRLIEDTRNTIAAHRQRLAGKGAVLVAVPDVSGRLFTVYGRASLPDAVLLRLGLRNAWEGPANANGTFRTGIEPLLEMTDINLLLVEIASMRPRVERALTQSALWQALPAIREGRFGWIEDFYPPGGLLSARHLANVIADRLGAA